MRSMPETRPDAPTYEESENGGRGPFKRYVVLSFAHYYPGGGFCDAIGSADTLEDAVAMAEWSSRGGYESSEVFDCEERRIVG